MIIQFNSQESCQIKLSPFHNLIYRFTNFHLDKNDFEDELNITKQIARNNGYNESLIDNIIKNKQREMIQKEFHYTQ